MLSQELINTIKAVLSSNLSAYRIAKEVGYASANPIHKLRSGESEIEKLQLGTALAFEKLYEEMISMKKTSLKSIRDFEFEGKVIQHSGWAGGDVPDKNIYKQFYTDRREDLKLDANHYAVWWDLSEFVQQVASKQFKWPAPHAVISVDNPESTLDYFSGMEPLGYDVEAKGNKLTIINVPVRFAPTGYDMTYWAGATDVEGNVYKVYWNIFNIIDPVKIEMTVDKSRQCKRCLKPWMLNETLCFDDVPHEYH